MVGLLSLRVLLPMPTLLSSSQVIAQALQCDDHKMIELYGKSIRLFALFPWQAAAGLRVCISAELCLASGRVGRGQPCGTQLQRLCSAPESVCAQACVQMSSRK